MHRLYNISGTVHTTSVTGQKHNFSELYSEFSYFWEHPQVRLIAVSLDTNPRLTSNVEVWPVKAFLEQLWAGKVF